MAFVLIKTSQVKGNEQKYVPSNFDTKCKILATVNQCHQNAHLFDIFCGALSFGIW